MVHVAETLVPAALLSLSFRSTHNGAIQRHSTTTHNGVVLNINTIYIHIVKLIIVMMYTMHTIDNNTIHNTIYYNIFSTIQ